MIESAAVENITKSSGFVTGVGQIKVQYIGKVQTTIDVLGKPVELDMLVLPKIMPNFQMILGYDALKKLGGVEIDENGVIRLKQSCLQTCVSKVETEINDIDFEAKFVNDRWVVIWK